MARLELLLLACACAASLAAAAQPAPTQPELEPAPSVRGYDVYNHDRHEDHQWNRRHNLVPWVDPTKKGVRAHGHSPEVEIQNEIVRWVHHPTFYQPIVAVDYRYLRNGRAYTRGRGGQVLILPYGNEVNAHNSYDKLIEEHRPGHEARQEIPQETPGHHERPSHQERPSHHERPSHQEMPSIHGLPYGRRNEGRDWQRDDLTENRREEYRGHGLGSYV